MGVYAFVFLQFALFQKEWRKSTMKWNEISTQWLFFFFWLEKRNDIWTNVTQIVCKARAKRDREREGGVREERERE